jgi:hypothetical protein
MTTILLGDMESIVREKTEKDGKMLQYTHCERRDNEWTKSCVELLSQIYSSNRTLDIHRTRAEQKSNVFAHISHAATVG